MDKLVYDKATDILNSIQFLIKERNEKTEALKYFKEKHVSDLITMSNVPQEYCLSKKDIIDLLDYQLIRLKERKESLEQEFMDLE